MRAPVESLGWREKFQAMGESAYAEGSLRDSRLARNLPGADKCACIESSCMPRVSVGVKLSGDRESACDEGFPRESRLAKKMSGDVESSCDEGFCRESQLARKMSGNVESACDEGFPRESRLARKCQAT